MACVVCVEEVSEWTIAVNVRVYQIIACRRIVISEIGIARVVVYFMESQIPRSCANKQWGGCVYAAALVGLEVKRDRMVSRVQSLT